MAIPDQPQNKVASRQASALGISTVEYAAQRSLIRLREQAEDRNIREYLSEERGNLENYLDLVSRGDVAETYDNIQRQRLLLQYIDALLASEALLGAFIENRDTLFDTLRREVPFDDISPDDPINLDPPDLY